MGQVTEIPIPDSDDDDKQAKSSLRFCMARKLRLVFMFSKGYKTNEGIDSNSKEKCVRDCMWSRRPTTVTVWPFAEEVSQSLV